MQIQTLRVAEGDDWKRLVEAWGDFLDRYEMLSRPDLDVGYWHREESLTGLLASAAWKSGGAGLVEFSTERTRMLPEESGTGYGDAYLWIGRQWYTVEAKLCWSAPGIEASLVSARDDLLSLRAEDRAGRGLVLVYCVPAVRDRPRPGLIEQLGKDLTHQFPAADLVVAYTAKESPTWGGYYYPGMVAVGNLEPWESEPKKS